MIVRECAKHAKEAALILASVKDTERRQALLRIADALSQNREAILRANAKDMERAYSDQISAPMRKRLHFDAAKMEECLKGLLALSQQPDPLGKTLLSMELQKGLDLYRVTCPIGVIGVIFESRPDALVQIASLCLRSGNAVLLKGGSEAAETNGVLFTLLNEAAIAAGIPNGWATLLKNREDVQAMFALDDLIDLIIPRGSNAFVRHIKENSRIPVLGHAEGLCHVYIDKAAVLSMACEIALDSKTQYVAVCNAAETLLVHQDIAEKVLPMLAEALQKAGVTMRGCERTRVIVACAAADDADWDTEYLDYILSIKVVDSLQAAIDHINAHGSGHTDTIVTEDTAAQKLFCAQVDSAGVFVNCSTRFADGYRYGFGAEVGIATGKLHARGPMGIEGLCTYKYKLIGNGQTVANHTAYTHRIAKRACPLEE